MHHYIPPTIFHIALLVEYKMACEKVALLLLAFAMTLTMPSFDPAFAEQDWHTIKLEVFRDCRTLIRKGNTPGTTTSRCCHALETHDVNVLCQHVDNVDEQTISPKKLVTVARACGINFDKNRTKHCGSKYSKGNVL
jgi:hypothetical protein